MFLQSAFFLFLFLFLLSCCNCRDTITADQPLKFKESLLSKENNFELWFFNPGNSTNWYVGIRYAKLPEKAMVWVANRDDPISDTSGVSLAVNEIGNLALYAHNNTNIPIWSTNVSSQLASDSSDTTSAQLLDTGNLVLINSKNGNLLWQSFDYPTDTYLPGMKIGFSRRTGQNWSISSWKAENDPGTGQYSYTIDLTGTPQFFVCNASARIWRSSPWAWSDHLTNISVYVNTYTYVNYQDEIYYRFFPNYPSKPTRTTVDKSGRLRLLVWNLNNGNQWDEAWAAPRFWCDFYAQCGANSKCSSGNVNRFACECLPGFVPRSPGQWRQRNASGGCLRRRAHAPSSTGCLSGDEFVTVARVNAPDTSTAVLRWGTSVGECERMCQQNCSCTAFMDAGDDGLGRNGCFMWHGELLDIVQYTDDGKDLHVRVHTTEAGNSTKPKAYLKRKRTQLAVKIISSLSTLLLCLAFTYCWLKRKSKSKSKTLFSDENDENMAEPELPFFHLSTITTATDNFSLANKLGEGGFGSVYKGQLLNGQKIAVKRLSKGSRQGVVEFKNEIMLIAKLQHRNLVKLLGCCVDGEEMMLIYEYMPNKSLDSFIFDQTKRSCLVWTIRFNIIIGVARGVLYLHQDSRLRVIHRDLKASNVLLDMGMNPKISDFGMARLFTGDQIQDKTNRIVGTYGYMSPEYVVFGNFSTKSDVFSFGVILLEIISGTKNNNNIYEEDSSTNLIGYVWKLWREDRTLEIVDSLLQSYNLDEALRCIQVGLLCVQEEVRDRPAMSAVVLMLSSEIALPSPKRPAYVFGTSNENGNTELSEHGFCSTYQSTITEVTAR